MNKQKFAVPPHPEFLKLQRPMRYRDPVLVSGLVDLCKELPQYSTGVEIGCFAGESSHIFLSKVNPTALFCIDPWDPEYYKNKQRLVEAKQCFDSVHGGNPVIRPMRMTGLEGLSLLSEDRIALDWIYIDGSHKYDAVIADIESAVATVRPGGIICGHDYGHKFKGLTRAVHECFGSGVLTFADTSWLVHLD